MYEVVEKLVQERVQIEDTWLKERLSKLWGQEELSTLLQTPKELYKRFYKEGLLLHNTQGWDKDTYIYTLELRKNGVPIAVFKYTANLAAQLH